MGPLELANMYFGKCLVGHLDRRDRKDMVLPLDLPYIRARIRIAWRGVIFGNC
jgi:hypothetical protein